MKTIKNFLVVSALLSSMVIALTGCSTKENGVKTYEKKDDFNEVIGNNGNTITSNNGNKDLFVKVWENEWDQTELQINEDGTFLIDHYSLSSQVFGTYQIDGMKIDFTNKDNKKWQGELVKESGFYQLKVNYDNNDLVLYDLSDKPEIKDIYKYDDGSILYCLCLYDNGTYKYEHSTFAAGGELGEYSIKEDKILLNAYYETGSDVGVSKKNKTMEVTINKDGTVSDKNNFFSDYEYWGLDESYKDFDFGNIVMKKASDEEKAKYLNVYPSIQKILSGCILEKNSNTNENLDYNKSKYDNINAAIRKALKSESWLKDKGIISDSEQELSSEDDYYKSKVYFIKINDIDGMPAYLVRTSIMDSSYAVLVTHNKSNVVVSKNRAGSDYGFPTVDIQKNIIKVENGSAGCITYYEIKNGEIEEIETFESNEVNNALKKYKDYYFVDITTELNEYNIDRLVK